MEAWREIEGTLPLLLFNFLLKMTSQQKHPSFQPVKIKQILSYFQIQQPANINHDQIVNL